MANNWYDSGRKYELDGNLKPSIDIIKACLLKSTYVPNLATDDFLDDLGTNRIGVDQQLAGITTTAGTLSASDTTFPAVPGGSQVNYIAIYKLVGDGSSSDTTSPLLALFDTLAGFPVTTSGADIPIHWGVGSGVPGAILRV